MAPAKTYIFVNGILNCPGSSKGWTDRAVTWLHTKTQHRGEKFEYFASALSRRLKQQVRAAELAVLLQRYRRDRIVLVGHSNGGDLICRALQLLRERDPLVRVAEVHLVSPACEASFERNGLNDALRAGQVQSIRVYVAGRDGAMRWARLSKFFFGWAGWGYGTLGKSGPTEVDPEHERKVEPIERAAFGHSSWWDAEQFDLTMETICSRIGNSVSERTR